MARNNRKPLFGLMEITQGTHAVTVPSEDGLGVVP